MCRMSLSLMRAPVLPRHAPYRYHHDRRKNDKSEIVHIRCVCDVSSNMENHNCDDKDNPLSPEAGRPGHILRAKIISFFENKQFF